MSQRGEIFIQQRKQQQGVWKIGGKFPHLPPPPILLGGSQPCAKPCHPTQYTSIFSTKPPADALSSRLYCAILDVSLIHHQKPNRFGKQPKLPQKIAFFEHFF